MRAASLGAVGFLLGLVAQVASTAVMAAMLAYGEKVLWFLAGRVCPSRWLRVGLPVLPSVRVVSSGAPRM